MTKAMILGLSSADVLAVAVFWLCWWGSGRWAETSPQSMSNRMVHYRNQWFQAMVIRENRIVDAALLTSLQNGAAFFASAALLAVGGMIAMLGQVEQLAMVAGDLSRDLPAALLPALSRTAWEAKLIALLALFVFAFMKFAWAHRLFGYCAIMIGAADSPQAARRAAAINSTAARSFNRGLRTVYFALALLAWFLGPVALMLATLTTFWMMWRREFASNSRAALDLE